MTSANLIANKPWKYRMAFQEPIELIALPLQPVGVCDDIFRKNFEVNNKGDEPMPNT